MQSSPGLSHRIVHPIALSVTEKEAFATVRK